MACQYQLAVTAFDTSFQSFKTHFQYRLRTRTAFTMTSIGDGCLRVCDPC